MMINEVGKNNMKMLPENMIILLDYPRIFSLSLSIAYFNKYQWYISKTKHKQVWMNILINSRDTNLKKRYINHLIIHH
jgi:hypothetical protein